MNAEPKKTDRTPERLSLREALRQAPGRFWRSCLHNWGWKLLSIFLALCLWAGLISQDPTLTRERVFTDVPVTLIGEDTLIRNGMVVLSGLEKDTLLVRLQADVPQRAYSATVASNYNPRIDLSRITQTGEQTLRILTTSSTTYGTVDIISPDSLTVVVDEYVTNYRVPVSINAVGVYPEGFYGSTPLLDPSSVAVSGPKSIVDKITNLYVDYDVSRLAAKEGLVRTALPMRFTDADGNEVDGSRLSVTSASVVLRTITVEQRLYPTKTLSVASLALTKGQPASGYVLKGITAMPATVLAAGDSSSLEALETLFTDSPVDIEGKSESFTVEIALRKPGSLYYLSDSTVNLQIEIVPVLTTKTFENIRLSLRGTELSAALEQNRVTVTVSGPQNTVDKLTASMLSAYVDASGLDNGEHILPVIAEIDGEQAAGITCVTTPASITVMLTAKEP